jgi:ribosomal protein L29
VNEELSAEELKQLLADARKEIIALKHSLSLATYDVENTAQV